MRDTPIGGDNDPVPGPDVERPWGCNWFWRPGYWSAPAKGDVLEGAQSPLVVDPEVAIFHDSTPSMMRVWQYAEDRSGGFGLALDVGAFHGSFVSAAIDLPASGVQGLRSNHLIRVNALFRNSCPCRVFFRLNLKHGSNTEQMSRECQVGPGWTLVDFDMAHVHLNVRRLDKIWLDLIFQDVASARINLRDLCFMRHPRADI